MRESFGGAFMIKLVLVFIVLYISFMAIAVNYAKTFRVKNNVINMLEQNQFQLNDEFGIIDDYLWKVPYNVNDGSTDNSIPSHCNNVGFGNRVSNTILTTNGVCIEQELPKNNTSNSFYYKVTAYISIKLPLFKISMIIPISGETKTITIIN